MRKLSEKEEDFLLKNPVVIATEYRRFRGRKDAETSLDAEKKATRAFSASYVRETCSKDLGDMVIHFNKTEEYKEEAQAHKEYLKKKNEAIRLGDKNLLKSLVDGIEEEKPKKSKKKSSKETDEDSELEELRAEYLEVVGKKAHHMMKPENMKEAIAEYKAKENK